MSDESAGMGANVGVRKVNEDGEVEQEEGVAKANPSRVAWLIFLMMVVLSGFGLWQIFELLHIL